MQPQTYITDYAVELMWQVLLQNLDRGIMADEKSPIKVKM